MTEKPIQLVHATTVSIDAKGVLIRGVPGSGKTFLALSLIRRARQSGLAAGLVADDQTILDGAGGGSIMARCPAEIAGKVELRPFGIVACTALPEAKVALVCDLTDDAASIERVQQGNTFTLLGFDVPHLCVQARHAEPNCSAVFAALGLPCWY